MKNEPHTIHAKTATSATSFVAQIAAETLEIKKAVLAEGAVLLRGFSINTPEQFERVALALEPNLQNNYAGTSPRNIRTKFVHTASELPAHYPIMQHCEMSFLPTAPRFLFFYCHVPPASGGETPICDFRKIYAQMDLQIRTEFETKGVRYIRNYSGLETRSSTDFFQLKKWNQLFKTTNHIKVEQECKKHEITPTWLPDDRLRLINDRPAMRTLSETGEKVWYNHLQVFHREAAAIEYRYIRKRRGDLFSLKYKWFLRMITWYKRHFKNPKTEAMHVVFQDGSAIPKSYVEHVLNLIWKNMIIYSWQKGDVLMIDNFSTSHGRLPYKGQRDILVAWSS